MAVRGPDGRPAGVVGVSLWGRPLPARAGEWLLGAASEVERRLARRAGSLGLQEAPHTPVLLVPGRVVGLRGGRTVVLPVAEIQAVTLDDGLIWLETEDGRVRSSARGLDQLEERLGPAGFLRVSRVAIVNLHRVRELAPAFKGGIWVVTDGGLRVSVSRRRVQTLRAALGL
jgi:DNA-binding LytR/AlgR family response regulator